MVPSRVAATIWALTLSSATSSAASANANRTSSAESAKFAKRDIMAFPIVNHATVRLLLCVKKNLVTNRYLLIEKSFRISDLTVYFSGQCICPPRVTGEKCDKCMPLTYGVDPIIGCVDCNCDPSGVENDLQCDLFNGSCT